MNLLKQSVLFTLVTVFMASSVFAEVDNQRKVDPAKAANEYSQSLIEQEKADFYQNAHQNANPIRNWTMEDYIKVSPENRHAAIRSDAIYVPSGTRDTDVTIEVCVDYWASEGSWNVFDFQTGEFLYAENMTFAEAYECQTVVETLADGNYSVDSFDSYGDGGQSVTVSVGGAIIAEGSSSGGYSSLGFEVGGAPPAVPGCTDAEACNFNPDATEDDGSCCFSNCVTLTCDGGSYQGEVSWEILDADSNIVSAGGAPHSSDECAEDGTYTLNAYDSWGDGWNGNVFSVTDSDENLLFQYTLDSDNCSDCDIGSYDCDCGSATYELGGDIPVYGCTDSEAVNYNPDANTDDGSCFYTGDVCEYPFEGAVGTNAHPGGEGWYAFTIPEAGYLNVTYPEYEMIQAIGECGLDEYGSFTDFINFGYQYFEQLFHATGMDYYGNPTDGRIGSTIHIRIAGWYTSGPADFDISWATAVEGCTDPQATNYNADANVDDGTCEYGECETNDLTMSMYDSWGDGWNGNVYIINDLSTGDLVAEGGLEAGSEGFDALCMEDGNYSIIVDYGSYQGEVSWSLDYTDGSGNVTSGGAPYDGIFTLGETEDVFGCTDPAACNYNPDATMDDGSCAMDGDICECSFDTGLVNGEPITGALTEAYDVVWYSFDVDADWDNLTISLCGSDFDTKIDIWNGCDNFLVMNDDSPECGLQSQFTLSPVTPGTGMVMIYGFGASYGNYVLTLTAWNNPDTPVLSAEGLPGGINLSWEPIPMRVVTSDQMNQNIIDANGTDPSKGEEPEVRHAPEFYNVSTHVVETENNLRDTDLMIYMQDSYGDGWNGNVLTIGESTFTIESGSEGEASLTLADGVYNVTCDGGSWQGEVSWQIVDAGSGEELLAGGAPYEGILQIGETDDVVGCMDPDAMNYGYNCLGENVGDPTIDDGCCEYPAPPNDLCEDAEPITGPYPVTVSGTTESSTIDCAGLLDWDAVWYDIDLPYENNTVNVTLCGDDGMSNTGIILMDDCACDDYMVGSYTFDGICIDLTFEVSGLSSILYPAFLVPAQGFELTVDVQELYVPSYNVYRFGDSIADGVLSESYFDGDVDAGTEYCYTVTQMLPDDGGESGHSNEACASSVEGIYGDTMDDPFMIDGIPFTDFGTTDGFFDNYDEECPYSGSTSPDVVYSYTASSDMTVDIDLCGEGTFYDTKVYVYENSQEGLAGCNDDECSNSHTNWLSFLSVDMFAGNTYYIVVDGYGGSSGDYELNISVQGMCADDAYEDDDTKDQATDHGGNATGIYALCADDNPDGLEQPGGFTAIDWSVVMMDPWTNLTALTFGDPPDVNDIDLFIEDYDGDGICQWGGGDDLGGSGNAFTEEYAEYSNLTDNAIAVYVGVIYFAGDNPINYGLTLVTTPLDCPECPQNLTATSGLESIDLAWSPPYVQPGGDRAGDEGTTVPRQFANDVPHSKKAFLPTQSKDELKISGLHPYGHGNPDLVRLYNSNIKEQKIREAHQNTAPISSWTLEDYIRVTPSNRHAALRSDAIYVPSGTRDTDVSIEVCIDYWSSEGSWNVYDYQTTSYLYATDMTFSEAYECQTVVETLASGDYSVDSYDSYGDGGQTVTVTVGGVIIAEGSSSGNYTSLPFTVSDAPPPVPGCTDAGACNYSSDATEDDGSCCYSNCLTMNMVDSYGDGWNGGTYSIADADGNDVGSGGLDTGSEGQDPLCLTDGDYTIVVGGGSWDSEISWSITDDATGDVVASGVAGDYGFTVGGATPSFGCTDPDAANYNPDATEDDGSCAYWGDVCDYPLESNEGSNEASGENQWFHYTVATDGSVTISSQNETEDAVWDTYLYVLGSCETDEYGNYNDVLGSNDDCCGYYGPSTVELNVIAGQDLYLYWYNAWGPGPFPFTITEGDAGEECVDDDFEDNDSSTSPAAIEPGTYDLVHCSVDPDWFEITVDNGQSLHLVVTEGVQEPSGMMDVGIWVFEIDPSYTQVYSPNLTEHDVTWSNNSDHPMIVDFAVGDFWAGAFEGTYTMTVELVDFEQTTYTVYRDGASIASELLVTDYSDMSIEDNVQYCYTVTANAGGVESPPSNEACETHIYIPPPDTPSNLTAEGGWLNVGGVDYPAVTWSWDYEFPEPTGTTVNIYILTDNYGSETSWDITNSDGNVVGDGGGFDSDAENFSSVDLDDGDYTFTIYDSWGDGICCDFGEGYYEVTLDDGTVLASGGEFGDSESTSFTIGGGRDEAPSQFNISDGSSEYEHGLRDILFELCFSYAGTDYCFQTPETSITIYGFAEGDEVCGWVYAIEDGIYSDPSETACGTAGASGGVEIYVDHAAGWNMVSIAVGTDANGVGDLFSGYIEGTLYEYPYNAVDALNLGQGYWLRFDSDGTDMQAGESVDDLGVSLSAGWNLIGSVSDDAGINDPDGIVVGGTLYGYPYSDPVTAITPGSGYWLRASADGMISLSTGGSLPRTTAELTANSMTINGMKLHFGVEVTEDLALSHSLPPKPPAGSFDVRFAGDSKIAEDAAVIQVMNPTDEITIEYTIVKDAGDHMLWVLAMESDEFVLEGIGSITLPGNVTGLTLNKVPEVPEVFGLSQNFPNPFNPVTQISFQVPEASDVTVSVYNMMGQKVADLVQAHVPAGYHQVLWDSRNLQGESVSSGVYLYTITSGDFHAMKKMILMK